MEQIERAKRYLERIKRIYQGVAISSEQSKFEFDDDVISFFIHCYHIRDWIVHLNVLGLVARDVDSYINTHKALMVCADLANGSKHCRLERSLRTKRQPYISGKERRTSTWFTGDRGGSEVMKCKYTIVSNTDLIDALQLASECVHLWESYIGDLRKQYSISVGTDAEAK